MKWPYGWSYIYILRDPRDNAIRYCGACADPRDRLNCHCSPGKKRPPVSVWTQELKAIGLRPMMQIIDCLEWLNDEYPEETNELERLWLRHLSHLGCDLLNIKSMPKKEEAA